MKYIDLFGGIGGFRYGIEQSNKDWQCVYYADYDKYAVQTYNKNFGTEYEPTDITKVDARDIPDHDIICGGFPCQAFSTAGKRGGFEDTRGTLFFEVMRIAKAKRTKYLFLENVKGLLNHNKGKTFTTILQTMEELGYDAQWMVLNSKFHGVPQNRERVFIIGHLRGTPKPEVQPYARYEKKNKPISIGHISKTLTTRTGSTAKQQTLITSTTPREMAFKDVSPTLLARDYKAPKAVFTHSLYPRSSKTGKGGTGQLSKIDQTSYCLDTGNAQAISYDRIIRKLTPLECERLQGFPDNWTDGQSDSQRYKQCGNAVTTKVITAIVNNWNYGGEL